MLKEFAVKSALEQAKSYRKKGEWERAVRRLERLAETNKKAKLELGYTLLYGTKYYRAIESFEELLDKNLTKEMEIQTLYGEALFFSKVGEYDDAIFLFSSIIQDATQLKNLTNLLVNAKIELSQLLVYQADLISADKHIKDALLLAEKYNYSLEYAKAIMIEARKSRITGNYKRALDLLNIAIAEFERVKDRKETIKAKNTLAMTHEMLGNYDTAENILLKIKPEANVVVGDQILTTAITCNLAQVMKLKGNYQEAKVLFEETLHIFNILEDKAGIARNLSLLGNLLADIGEQGKAIEFFRQAVGLLEEMGNKYELATVVGLIAQTQFSLGQLKLAESFFVQAMEQYDETKSEINLVSVLTSYAELLMIFGKEKFSKIEQLIIKSFKLAEKHESSLEILKCRITKAIFQIYQQNFGSARQLLKDAGEKAKRINAYQERIRVYLLLAEIKIFKYQVRYQEYDIDKAMEYLVIAEELAEQQGLLPLFLETQMVKASLYAFKLNFDVAINTLLKAEKEAKKYHLIGLQQRAEILLKQIKNRTEFKLQGRLKEEDNMYGTTRAIRYALKEKNRQPEYVETRTSFLLFEIAGVAPTLISKLRFTGNLAEISQFGVYFTLALGQGEKLRNGLYGPLPIPDETDRVTLIFIEEAFGHTYLMCFLFPKGIKLQIKDRNAISAIFSKTINKIINKRNPQEVLSKLSKKLSQILFI